MMGKREGENRGGEKRGVARPDRKHGLHDGHRPVLHSTNPRQERRSVPPNPSPAPTSSPRTKDHQGGRGGGGALRSRMDAEAAMGCSHRAHDVKASQQQQLQETVRGSTEDAGKGGRSRQAAAVALWPSGEQRTGAAVAREEGGGPRQDREGAELGHSRRSEEKVGRGPAHPAARSVAAADQLTLKTAAASWMYGRARARGSNPAPTHL